MILAVYATVDAVIVAAFTVSIGLTLRRFRRSARENPFDAATWDLTPPKP